MDYTPTAFPGRKGPEVINFGPKQSNDPVARHRRALERERKLLEGTLQSSYGLGKSLKSELGYLSRWKSVKIDKL